MKNSLILLVAALLVSAVGGFIAAKNTSPATVGSGGEERVVIQTQSGEHPEGLLGDAAHPRPAAKGIDEIAKLPGRSNQIQAMVEFYADLSIEQLEEEARKLELEDLSWNDRQMARLLLFGRWGELDAHSALEHAKGMGLAGGLVMPTILQSWASVDPVNAARYYEKNPREFEDMDGHGLSGGGGNNLARNEAATIASKWARQDPQAALMWANSFSGEKREGALSSVVGEVLKVDPAKAAQMLSGVNAKDARDSYHEVAEVYGSKNFAEAQSWIQSLPADQQPILMAKAIEGLAETDLNAAVAHVATIAAGDAKDWAVDGVAEYIARENPQAAAEYVMQNGGAMAQELSVYTVVPEWVEKDPAAALTFVNTLPEGEVRDSGLSQYVVCNSSAPFSELVQVAESISDEGERSGSVDWIVLSWMSKDEAAVKAYIQNSTSVSDEMKEHLLGEK